MADGLLEPFLQPRSVAIVGASDDPTRIGGRPLRYLLEAGFEGPIYPVNPARATVQGIPAFASLLDLPRPPDLVIIAVARERVRGVVEECATLGSTSATVFASGFAETGEAGRADQEELRFVAARRGVRLLGPNCNGTMSPEGRAPLAFTPVLAGGLPAAGSIAVATQSAAVGTYWLRRLRERRLGMRAWVHTGNEVDIGLADVLSHFLDDPGTRTILCVLEQWRRPAELEVLLDRLPRSGKDLVVLPLGQSAVGRRAALSHTGGLVARGTNVVTGLLRQAGAHVVGGLEEGLLLAETLNAGLRRVGRRVGILTPSGGLGILLADALCGVGFELPEFDPALQTKWRGLVPFCSPRNPVDATAQMINQPELFTEFARDMVSSGQIDVLAAFLPTAEPGDELSMSLIEVAGEARSRGVRIVAVGAIPAEVAATFSDHGIAVFQEPRDAARVLGLLLDVAAVAADAAGDGPAAEAAVGAPAGAAVVLRTDPAVSSAMPDRPVDGARTTDEMTVKAALTALGVEVVADVVADDEAGAAAAAARLGFPVVLKRLQAGLAHKAREGGVIVGLETREEVLVGAGRILAAPGSRVLVEPMVLGDELLVALTRDADWGLLALLGLGGVAVEERGEVAFRRAPLELADLRSMIAEVPGLTALFGLPGRGRALESLLRTFAALQRLAEARPALLAVELNPVIVRPDGRCIVVDGLIEWS